jgi:hypothetical protein
MLFNYTENIGVNDLEMVLELYNRNIIINDGRGVSYKGSYVYKSKVSKI